MTLSSEKVIVESVQVFTLLTGRDNYMLGIYLVAAFDWQPQEIDEACQCSCECCRHDSISAEVR